MTRTLLTLLTAVALLATGCLKRIESIVIAPDGSAKLFICYEGDREDVLNGDAMPSADTGWQVVDKVTDEGKGEDDHSEDLERRGLRQVCAGEPFPSSYAAPGSPLELVALRFPTTLTIEQRDDGTYYHFRRAYRARQAARIEFLHQDILEDEDLQEITDKDPRELTEEDRRTLAKAFIEFEAGKTLTFIDQAAASLGDEVAPDAWLPMRPEVQNVYGDKDLLEKAIVLMRQENMDEHLALLEKSVLDDVVKTISLTLRGNRAPEALIARFVDAYDQARRDYQITEDLADEEFHVNIQMPGRIIAHNCDDLPPLPLVSPSEGSPETKMSMSVKLAEPEQSTSPDETASAPESVRVSTKLSASELLALPDEAGSNTQPVAVTAPSDSELGLDEELFRENSKGKYLANHNRCAWRFEGSELRDYDLLLMATSFVPKEK